MNRSAQDIDWSRSAIYLSKESSLGREEMLRPNVVQIPAEALALELGPQGHPLGDVQLPLQLSRLCGSDRAGFNYPNCPSSIVVTRRIDSEFYKHFLNFASRFWRRAVERIPVGGEKESRTLRDHRCIKEA